MVTLHIISGNTGRAALCALGILLSACGGGGGAGPQAAAAVAAPSDAQAGSQANMQPAPSGTSAVAVPMPPDMSIVPPPGTVVTPAPLDAQLAATASVAGDGAPSVSADPAAPTVGTPVAAELPEGAIACQPGICPPFDANGSVTNMQGNANPTAAGAYLLPASSVASTGYPDLSRLPVMMFPTVPIVFAAAPD